MNSYASSLIFGKTKKTLETFSTTGQLHNGRPKYVRNLPSFFGYFSNFASKHTRAPRKQYQTLPLHCSEDSE